MHAYYYLAIFFNLTAVLYNSLIIMKTKLYKMNKLQEILKGLLLVVLMGSLVTFTSCDEDDEEEEVPTETLLQLVSSTDNLDSLAKYLTVYPTLTGLLGGSTEYTFFAPDNNAFISLLATPGFPSDIADISPDLIAGVLAYHIVPTNIAQADLVSGMSTLYTDAATGTVQTIDVNADGTLKTGSTNQEIEISTGDILGTNGRMHVVSSVMIPPTVGAALTPILGTLAGSMLLGTKFTYMAGLITSATTPDGEASLTEILASPNTDGGGWTMFAPANEVFDGMAAVAGITTEQLIGSITDPYTAVLKMISSGTVAKASFTNQQQVTDLSGRTFLLIETETDEDKTPEGWVLVSATNADASPAPIYLADNPNTNGVLHVSAILFD